MGCGVCEARGDPSRCRGGGVTGDRIVHSIKVECADEDYNREAFEQLFVAVSNIARVLLPGSCITVENGGMVSESVRGNGSADNSVSGNYWSGINVSDTHHHIHVREERGVEGVRFSGSARAGRDRSTGPGVAGQPEGAESGSDRLTGPPRGPLQEVAMPGSHRGRRRRLFDTLKRVSAGTRFRR